MAEDAARIPGDAAGLAAGYALGHRAASAIIALRSADGSQYVEPVVGGPFTPIGGVGHWSPDPVSKLNVYLGAYWGAVTPFTMASGDQFRAPPPPALTDPAYTKAFNQVENVGGDPRFGTPTGRTRKQTFEGIFWSYDGTPALCAPPRLYNQVARAIVLQKGMNSMPEAARMLALINTAMADAAISAWNTKWYYQYWRPVTAIRSPDQAGNTNVTADPHLVSAGRPGHQHARPQLHAALSGICVRPRNHRWRAIPDPAPLLSGRHAVHFHLGRVQRHEHECQRPATAAASAELRLLHGSRDTECGEPRLYRRALAIRCGPGCDRGP